MKSRLTFLLALVALLTPVLHGYYFFVQYPSRNGPFTPLYTKFDLNALSAKAVPFLISEQGPATLAAGDNMNSLISEIRLAATAWNDVPTADLKLAFGGFFTPGVQHSSPVIEVVFEDIPPGVIALGGPTSKADVGPADTFVPILRSQVKISRDLSSRASWSEALYLTMVHEFGHALGLQHSLTSSVMSTEVTRGTTKAQPLAADDIAGLSLLYPVQGASSGTIQGRVTLGGTGINLASVVAISPDGLAISALTHPDGTYRIEGLPSGSYYIYAHPLPPAISGEAFPAGINPPTDLANSQIPVSGSFETIFFPGTKNLLQAVPAAVYAGSVVEGVNFSVTRRSAPAIYGVTTYSFPGQVAVKPAHLSMEGGRPFLVAAGYGLTANAGIQVLGGSAVIPNGGVRPYPLDNRYLQIDLQVSLLSGEGSRHLVFSSDNDLYVLPSAFRITRRTPPQITAVTPTFDPAGNRVVILNGTNFTPDTRILFDGVAAVVRGYDDVNAAITVVPPAGISGMRSAVVALNSDGQSSLFLQGNSVPAFDYDLETGFAAAAVAMTPNQLPAGSEAMVEITGAGNLSNAANYLNVTFGTSGVRARRIWDGGPNRLLANVVISPNAVLGSTTAAVINGLRTTTIPFGWTVTGSTPRQSSFQDPVVDATTGRPDTAAGALAQARLVGAIADVSATNLQVTVGERPAQVVSFNNGTLVFRVPTGLTPGPAVLRVTTPTGDGPRPVVMSIDVPPPVVVTVTASGTRIDASRPARPGELLVVVVTGAADNDAEIGASRVKVNVGGTTHNALQVNPANGTHVIQFVLDASVPQGSQPLTVSVDGRVSAAFALPVRTN
ncbi:MAG: IPT/TIG domain-containing protein [Bryobacterales bacterium]|nr:IPT/TIG domain-containing protein [Bryobacterales bacterium]